MESKIQPLPKKMPAHANNEHDYEDNEDANKEMAADGGWSSEREHSVLTGVIACTRQDPHTLTEEISDEDDEDPCFMFRKVHGSLAFLQ